MFINNIYHKNIHSRINFLDNKVEKNNKPDTFIKYIQKSLEEISTVQNNAKIDAEKFSLNQSGISLNDVMINLQKSSISIQMAIQVRNKIVSAYQEIMNQQI